MCTTNHTHTEARLFAYAWFKRTRPNTNTKQRVGTIAMEYIETVSYTAPHLTPTSHSRLCPIYSVIHHTYLIS